MGTKEDIAEILGRLIPQIQGVKLGPGVVGRNSSIAWALEFVMLAGVITGGFLHSVWLVGISLLGAIVCGLFFALVNVQFGKDNPAAALLEGIEFLQFHQMQATAKKGEARVVELPFATAVQSPEALPGEPKKQLDSPESDS
jgi:general stress protein CsbA